MWLTVRNPFLAAVLVWSLMLSSCGDDESPTGTDTTPPAVVSANPVDGATNVPINSVITATFSENMNPSTIAASTFMVDNGVTATVISYGDRTATFTPSSDLSYGATYTATITTGVTDMAGNAMASSFSWTFTTEAPIGRAWFERTSGTQSNLKGLAWSGSQFVAIGGMTTILTSPDGVIWTQRTSPTTAEYLHDVIGSDNLLIIVGENGTIITSPDGITWTERTTPTTSGLSGVAFSDTLFVAVGSSGTIVTSTDGQDWTARTSGVLCDLSNVAWSGSRFVAIVFFYDDCDSVLTSEDGITWTARPLSFDYALYDVTWAGNQFVVVGHGGEILTSPDGITWTQRVSWVGPESTLAGVTWSGTQLVAVGWEGRILTSPDGVNWTEQVSGTSNGLYSVAWSGERFVAVGGGGTILSSP